MRRNRCIQFVLIAAGLAGAFFAGCGKDESAQKAPKNPAPVRARKIAGNSNKSNPMANLSRVTIDTLRAKMRVFGVTRSEYWETRGGELENDNFVVYYPPGEATITHGIYLLEEAEFARQKFIKVFGTIPAEKLRLVTTLTMNEFKKRTGKDWWFYSDISKDTLIFQPIYILINRGLGPIGITHEISKWGVNKMSANNAPLWLVEGLSSFVSNERLILIDQLREFKSIKMKMSPQEVEAALKDKRKRSTTRIAYYNAFKMVEKLIGEYGTERISEFTAAIGKTGGPQKASQAVYDKSYETLLKISSKYAITKKK